MKKLLLCLSTFCWSMVPLQAQSATAYDVTAVIDDEHVVTATMTVSLVNSGAREVDTVYLECWADAYSDRRSVWMRQQVERGRLEAYFDNKDSGYRSISVEQSGVVLSVVDSDVAADIRYVLLAQPLAPGASIDLDISYVLQLPRRYGSLGYTDSDVWLQHWYPQVATYDRGWQPRSLGTDRLPIRPWASQRIHLVAPIVYTVAARGIEQDRPERDSLRSIVIDQGQCTGAVTIALLTDVKKSSEVVTLGDQVVHLHVLAKKGGGRILDLLATTMSDYAAMIGPYPWDEGWLISSTESQLLVPGMASHVPGGTLTDLTVASAVGHWWMSSSDLGKGTEAWLHDGLITYYAMRYLAAGASDITRQDCVGCPSETASSRHMLLRYFKTGYLLPLSEPVASFAKADYMHNSSVQPLQAMAHLAAYLGDDFDIGVKQYLAQHAGKRGSARQLQQTLQEVSGKTLDWLFDDIANGREVDYRVAAFRDQVAVQQRGSVAAPIPLGIGYDDGESEMRWLDGVKDDTLITLPRTAADLVLDPHGVTMDLNYANNYLSRPIKWQLDNSRPNEASKVVELAPLLTYNYTDRFTIGVTMHNDQDMPSKWHYHLSPQYAIGTRSLVGSAAVRHARPVGGGGVDRVEYGLSMRRFHFDTFTGEGSSSSLDNAFLRISPSLRVYLDELDRTTYTELEYIILQEEELVFDVSGVSQDILNSAFLRWGIHSRDHGYINTTDYSFMAEGGRYTSAFRVDESYIKLSGEVSKRVAYSPRFGIQMRLWGAAFVTNTASTASANTSSYKGVIGLSHQPFNDYSYDNYYIDRLSTASFATRQVNSELQGGFKHATGLPMSSNIGQSQRHAMAVNLAIDLPIKPLRWATFQVTADAGAYSQQVLPSGQEMSYLYSVGLSMQLDGVVLHLPLVYSDAFADAYGSRGILDRVTFSIDLQRFDFWTNSIESFK